MTPDIRLISASALGSFSWRWPEEIEHFERGYAALVRFQGSEFRIRHGISRRTAYGRLRLHSVTWVENNPTVEGVEADDFAHSQSLLSLIKVTKRHLRPTDPLPPEYSGFTVGVMSEEAAGRYSPRSLAVKIRLDDIDGWSRHALLRAAAWGRLSRKRRFRSSLPATTAPGPRPEELSAGDDSHAARQAVAAALLQHGSTLKPGSAEDALDFTPNAEANELLRKDAFAFLTGVLFDQGIPAERAWIAPYLLQQRIGHLDPAQIASNPEAVRRAIQMQPKLHRYVEKMPRWLVGAARRVGQDYRGDASAIWSDRPAAVELQRRLREFHGIGQKKAAMTVEILHRDLGVPIDRMAGGDVAVDVHVRRVFLRSRIADRDDRDHMITAARQLHSSRPGALDFPAWDVGRNWCHAGTPACGQCPLTHVCPKDIERAAHVTSG
ncbi:MAG: hypothetical protein OXG19_04085 [Chloroflexi bacterium]|nr:hypothetical protein [Chloroflexota bacterium]